MEKNQFAVLSPLEAVERKIGLHQNVEIFYAVDCFIATFYTMDGGKRVAEGRGLTILEALNNLQKELEKQG